MFKQCQPDIPHICALCNLQIGDKYTDVKFMQCRSLNSKFISYLDMFHLTYCTLSCICS